MNNNIWLSFLIASLSFMVITVIGLIFGNSLIFILYKGILGFFLLGLMACIIICFLQKFQNDSNNNYNDNKNNKHTKEENRANNTQKNIQTEEFSPLNPPHLKVESNKEEGNDES